MQSFRAFLIRYYIGAALSAAFLYSGIQFSVLAVEMPAADVIATLYNIFAANGVNFSMNVPNALSWITIAGVLLIIGIALMNWLYRPEVQP